MTRATDRLRAGVAYRLGVVSLLALWAGGFVFYAAFVVPVGNALLPPFTQGSVTSRVVARLHLCGIVALLAVAVDAWAERWRWRLACCQGIALALQIVCARWLREFMSGDGIRADVEERFATLHSVYLMLSTVQWVLTMMTVATLLLSWQSLDRRFSGGDRVLRSRH